MSMAFDDDEDVLPMISRQCLFSYAKLIIYIVRSRLRIAFNEDEIYMIGLLIRSRILSSEMKD